MAKCEWCTGNGTEIVTFGDYTTLYRGSYGPREVFIFASGDATTPSYHPRYCPECGRRVNEDIRNEDDDEEEDDD